MVNRNPHSEETKAKIRASMMKKFWAHQISKETKINWIQEEIIIFLEEKRQIVHNINQEITINSHWSICDEDNTDNTKDISILDFMKWICKRNL
jgi:hypothetical protein